MSEEETSTSDTGAASLYAARQATADRMDAVRASATRRPDWTIAAIVVILFIALLLRLWGVNWDGGLHLHPDERFLSFVTQDIEVPGSIGAYFDSENSKLNPYNRGGSFVYGTFPLFLTKIVGEAADKVENAPVIGSGIDLLFDNRGERSRDLTLAGYDGNLVGRTLSALFDTGTVFLVFLIGGLLFNRRVALLAAFLVAISAFHIQLSHFFTVDTFATFFTLLTIYFSVRISKGGSWPYYALAGAAYGFALSSKISALPLAGVIVLAVLIRLWPVAQEAARRLRAPASAEAPTEAPAQNGGRSPVELGALAGLGLLLALLAAFLVFRVAQPYAFEGPNIWNVGLSQQFLDDMRSSLELQAGGDFPPNIQWVGRTSYIFPLKNMVLWGMGLPLGLAAWAGFFYAGWRFLARRDARALLLLVWIAVSFVYWGGRFNPIMRSFLPIYPPLILLAALMLVDLWEAAPGLGRAVFRGLPAVLQRWQRYLPFVLRGTVAAVVVLTLFWALAFTNIYGRTVSRVEAGQWLSQYAPQGSVIAGEHWDDGLPLDGQFERMEFSPYDKDSPEKVVKLINDLDRADFITITSNRLYDSIPRIPAQYPVTTRYYELLFAEELGFRHIKEFTSYPTLFGISIPDQSAEESFTVYDHPKVDIFEKTDDFSRDRVAELLRPDDAQLVIHLAPSDADQNGLMLRPDDLVKQQSGGTWSELFDPGSLTNRFPLITWLLVIQLAALAMVPLAVVLFRGLPDGGYLLTKPLGLLALAYPVWLGTSLKLFDFTRGSAIAVLVVLVLGGSVAAWLMRDRLWEYLRQHWRMILFGEVLFLVAFLVFYFIRMDNPDLWHTARGGEKPMDFAYLNAVTRSTTLPPYDPWFSGGYINYYYFGQFMTGNLIKITGILPEVAFNLAVPLFFSISVAATFSLGYNLAEASRRMIRRRPGWLRIAPWTAVLAGLLAVFLVLIAGNLNSANLMKNQLETISPWQTDVPFVEYVPAVIGGGAELVFGGGELGRYDYWDPSRAIKTDPGNNAITEFPYFTFLFADLHAHLMAIPFTILSLGLGLALIMGAKSESKGGGSSNRGSPSNWWRRLLPVLGLIALLGLVLGATRWTNSWDYPTYLIAGLAAVVLAERVRAGGFDLAMLRRTALLGGLLALLSLAFFQPFSSNYALPATGFQAMPEGLPRTPFHQYLSHFGLFIFMAGSMLTFFSYRFVRRHGAARSFLALVSTSMGVLVATTLAVGFAGPASGYISGIEVTGLSAETFLNEIFTNTIPVAAFSLFGLAVVILLVWDELRSRRPDTHIRLLVLGLIGLALLLSAAVEIAVLNPDIGRQNTVFKFYLQIWILLALASSFSVWYLAAALAERWTSIGEWFSAKLDRPSIAVPRLAFGVMLAILLIAVLAYPIQATRWRVRLPDRFTVLTDAGEPVAAGGFTNNGLAFMEEGQYGWQGQTIEFKYDYDAILWLRDNVAGSPVIIEGIATGPYQTTRSRISINTGLPTVLGWDFHQIQQRGQFAAGVGERAQDITTFYSTTDAAAAERILVKYGISYVIVGQLERFFYPAEGIAKFDSLVGRSLEPVYANPQTVIYHVAGTPNPLTVSAAP